MNIEYPKVYSYADEKSAKKQQWYFRLLISEYALLFVIALNSFFLYEWKYIFSFVLIAILVVFFLIKKMFSLTSEWYKYRALAESVKTTCWRYIMRAEPFNSDNQCDNYEEFKDSLTEIIKDSNIIPKKIKPEILNNHTVTESMRVIESLSLEEKKAIYLKERIEDQYSWYTRKSTYNKNMAKKWSNFIISLYILALIFSFYNIFFHSLFIFPVAVLTTLASAFIGWSQIKRYDELQSSYLLTAGEILGIKEQVHYISNDSQLSAFVRDAELAFSREHTQWTARRSSS